MSFDPFWSTFLRALEAEPREAKHLRGISGLDHSLSAIGVDPDRDRLLVITSESDPRSAAFAQSDIQAAFPNLKVIAGRVEWINRDKLADVALASSEIKNPEDIKSFFDTPIFREILSNGLNALHSEITFEDREKINQVMVGMFGITLVLFMQLIPVDQRQKLLPTMPIFLPHAADALVGLATIPLYQLSNDDLEKFRIGTDVDYARDVLSKLSILQYFFPPPDQLALGFVDRGSPTRMLLLDELELTRKEGHPFSSNEILPATNNLNDLIDTLSERGYVTEMERTLEITEEGRRVREVVKVQPRESLLSKIISRFSLRLNLKDLFK